MRNINLNSRFGFELEGVFLDDITVGDKHQDVVRMALFKSPWLQIFSRNALEHGKPAVIRVYDDAGKVIEAHEAAGDFKEP
jgi:hypothetical protein